MKNIIAIVFACFSVVALGQDLKVVEGDLKALKDQTSIGLKFTYENMIVGDEKTPEDEYVRKKKEEFNTKEAGRGDKWEKAWIADRSERFEPKFRELFEKYAKKQLSNTAKYTLIFNTTRTEPGWVGVGIIRRNAQIDGEALIVETANPSKVIAKVLISKAPGWGGMGYDYDTGLRIQEAYAKSGKELGKLVGKK